MAKKSEYTFTEIELGLQSVADKKGKLIGYRGYSHRGGAIWQPGMKLFDAKYKMPKTHPNYKKYEAKAKKSEFAENIMEVVPFSERGSKTIKTLAETKQAAKNFANYMA